MPPTSIRIPQHLRQRIDELATEERRTFSNMVIVLLEQALESEGERVVDAKGITIDAAIGKIEDEHFKPDFGKKLR